jgi:hypothetical protein
VVVVLGSFAYGLISMAVLAASGREIPWLIALVVAVLPSAIVNALFTPIVYLPIRWFLPAHRLAAVGLGSRTPV